MAGLERRYVDGKWQTVADDGGGSLPVHQTATVETDPDTFMAPDTIFDLDGFSLTVLKFTIVAFDPDGETPGLGATDILVYPVPDVQQISDDGVTYRDQGVGLGSGALGGQFEVGDVDQDSLMVPRFVKVLGPQIIFGTFSIYNGANNPTATVRIDVYATALTT